MRPLAMTDHDAARRDLLKEDLAFVAQAVRRNDTPVGIPALYFLWAAITVIGFALPDFAPERAGAFWFVVGTGGGLLSWWIGKRDTRRQGLSDNELGWRYGYHWGVCGIAFLLAGLPLLGETVPPQQAASVFLLIAGLANALAGVHLARPYLWSGLLMLAAYGVLALFDPPYTWTIAGVAIGAAMVWAGLYARAKRRAGALQ